MIKATEEAEQIAMLLHSSNCHVSFNDEVCTIGKDGSKSPKGIPKRPKPRQIQTELDVFQPQFKLSPRDAQSADYFVRFQNKHEKCHKRIIESDSMKYIKRNYQLMKRSTTLTCIHIHLSDQIVTCRRLKCFCKLISFPTR
jgi:hypothetical protein